MVSAQRACSAAAVYNAGSTQVYWSTKHKRELLAEEKMGVHLLPHRPEYAALANVTHPIYSRRPKDIDLQKMAGNGMSVPAVSCLCYLLFLFRQPVVSPYHSYSALAAFDLVL